MVIDVKFKHLQKLKERRKEVLAQGVLIQGADDYVPARIRHGNETIKVKLRLKGDWADQFIRDRWSFRVHVKGKAQIFGLRRFSLHHPSARDYHGEPMFLEFSRSEGVLAPRYKFVDVTLNGDSIGRMALEEHFSKELLESQGRKESVIIKFDESLVWSSTNDGRLRGFGGIFDNYATALITPFRGSKIKESPVLSKNLQIATGLLRGFVYGQIPASQAFDTDLMGKFLGVAHMWGAWHSLRWHNVRFYYNPITTKLEPIAFDSTVGDPYSWEDLYSRRDTLTSALLKDPLIWSRYLSTLKRLDQELKSGERIQWLESLERTYLQQLGTHYPFLRKFDFGKLRTRTSRLLKVIHEVGGLPFKNYQKNLSVFTYTKQGRSVVEVGNLTPLPIEIVSIQWADKIGPVSIPFETRTHVNFPIPLSQTLQYGIPQLLTIEFLPPPQDQVDHVSLLVSYRIQGQQYVRIAEALPYYSLLDKSPLSGATPDVVLAQYPFVLWDRESKQMTIPTGNWKINRPLRVPEGIRVNIEPGATLEFSPGSYLFVRGPLMMKGTEKLPITLKGQGKGDERGNWQGIVVLQAQSQSFWSHVNVYDTTGIVQPDWSLTGGVTLYESEIHMENCHFRGNVAEDALNIVRTNFHLTNVDIEDAASDGLDVDFGEGKIFGGSYSSIGSRGGGDAIDVSGSQVVVENVVIRHIQDKGLSVGEGSSLKAKNVHIERASVGAVSKDGSLLEIVDSRIESVTAALMAYTKKPEFGPGKIVGEKTILPSKSNTVRVQDGSAVELDGISMSTENIDVEELYNTSMKSGRKS